MCVCVCVVLKNGMENTKNRDVIIIQKILEKFRA